MRQISATPCSSCGFPVPPVRDKRDAAPMSKVITPRTMRKWNKTYGGAAVFIYLLFRSEFDLFPVWFDDLSLAHKLLNLSRNLEKLQSFFGAYAYAS